MSRKNGTCPLRKALERLATNPGHTAMVLLGLKHTPAIMLFTLASIPRCRADCELVCLFPERAVDCLRSEPCTPLVSKRRSVLADPETLGTSRRASVV